MLVLSDADALSFSDVLVLAAEADWLALIEALSLAEMLALSDADALTDSDVLALAETDSL